MKQLSLGYINGLVSRLELYLFKSLKKKQYDKSIVYMKAISYMRYWFFLGYEDELIEKGLHIASSNNYRRDFSNLATDMCIIFLDTICSDTIGLTQQYLDALIDKGYKIYYIYEKGMYSNGCDTIMKTLNNYSNAILFKIPSNIDKMKKAQWIYNCIMGLDSEKIIYHTAEWAIEECIALCSLPHGYTRYKINLADHTYWPGLRCFDYIFEFRSYGANLSLKYRGLRREQLIYMPFYPAMKEIPFSGFPKCVSDKIIFLSGGSPYKVVDDDNTFFRLCKKILDRCPNSVVLFAGANENDRWISKIKEDFQLGDRFLAIDYRRDIYEVFKHSDVFINTYPVGGGLMCQYAAQCSTPILNYKNKDIEECVAQKSNIEFTTFSESDFLDEAYRLYIDSNYRKSKGNELHKSVITKDDFNICLDNALTTNTSLYNLKFDDNFKPRDLKSQDNINFRNKSLIFFYYDLYEIMGNSMFTLMPKNFAELYPHIVKRDLKRFMNKIKNKKLTN